MIGQFVGAALTIATVVVLASSSSENGYTVLSRNRGGVAASREWVAFGGKSTLLLQKLNQDPDLRFKYSGWHSGGMYGAVQRLEQKAQVLACSPVLFKVTWTEA